MFPISVRAEFSRLPHGGVVRFCEIRRQIIFIGSNPSTLTELAASRYHAHLAEVALDIGDIFPLPETGHLSCANHVD